MTPRQAVTVVLVAALLGGCGRQPERVRTGPDARTTAAVERVRLSLLPVVDALDAARADGAAKDGRIAALTAELDRLRASRESRPAASRSGRRLSGVPARSGPCGGWEGLIGGYDWPVGLMCRVAWCESKWQPGARNASGHNGLFQIAGGPFDPSANVRLAFSMWSARGLQPWAASRGCWG